MATFRFSRLGETDLVNIGDYTLRTWGAAQTIKYLDELESACERLASSPLSGRPCDDIRPGLYRFEIGKHVIFYRRMAEQMLPGRHAFADEDADPA